MVLETTTVTYLANRGSVFVYDYRGYGKSTGTPSSIGCLKDSIEAYKFLVDVKKVDPKNIILYGHSLGACVTTFLMNHVLHYEDISPDVMIIQNAFENIQRVCNDIIPLLGKFIVSDMKTDLYIKNIDNLKNNIKICIIHSKDDELIHFNHGCDLAKHVKNNNLKLILLDGTHDEPVHDESVAGYLNEISKNR